MPRQPRPTIPAAGGKDHELQTKTEEIASAIGAPGEVEMIFKSLEHAAANIDHPIKNFLLDFHSVPGINMSRERNVSAPFISQKFWLYFFLILIRFGKQTSLHS